MCGTRLRLQFPKGVTVSVPGFRNIMIVGMDMPDRMRMAVPVVLMGKGMAVGVRVIPEQGTLKFKAPGGIAFHFRLLHNALCIPMIRISRKPRQRDILVFSSYDYPATDEGAACILWLCLDHQEWLYPAVRCMTHCKVIGG